MGDVATIPPRKAALTTGGAVAAMVPTTIESAWRLSEVIAASGMAPKSYGTDPNKVMVGILAGMEVGFTPFAALQSIAVINGNPQVWGDGALALVQASGLLEDIEETDDGNRATCTVKRVGKSPVVRTFDMDDAKRAGLAGKAGPWTQYPRRMRQMRARAFAIRDAFPDVLKGLRIAEEVQDYQDLSPAVSPPHDDSKPSGRALLAASLGAEDDVASDQFDVEQETQPPAMAEEAAGHVPHVEPAEVAAAGSEAALFDAPDYVEQAASLDARYRACSDMDSLRQLWADTAAERRAIISADGSYKDVFAKVIAREKARLEGEMA